MGETVAMQEQRRNGSLELKFNEDRTQVVGTIYPAAGGGNTVQAIEVTERVKAIGVTYGIREQAIMEAVHHVQSSRTMVQFVAAQGTLPQDGKDAIIHYRLPIELLSKPIPKTAQGWPDWFSLDPKKLVKADEELAVIVPANGGSPGKTLTWPLKDVPPKPGKPAALCAGPNVRSSDDGLRLFVQTDGYVVLHNEKLTVHAVRLMETPVAGGSFSFPAGGIFLNDVKQAQITAGEFVAIKGAARNCRIRSHGDVFVTYAENCTIIATGHVYVSKGLWQCDVNTPQRVITATEAGIVGGAISAQEGIEAGVLGAPDFTPTQVLTGMDRYSAVRTVELEEEIAACEANIDRISQALKPFVTLSVHTTLPEDKRMLLQKLQAQKRSQEARINEIHSERRQMSLGAKNRRPGPIKARTVYPGVWVGICNAALQVEAPLNQVQFVEGSGGKSVEAKPLLQAA
jgi:uncharacterized protein (DUF342 family)